MFKKEKLMDYNEIIENGKPILEDHEEPGIYFLLSGNCIIYIGKTLYFEKRLQAHIKDSDKEFDCYFFIPCKKEEMNSLEAHYIAAYIPMYNLSFPGCKGYKCICKVKTPGETNMILNDISGFILNNKLYIDMREDMYNSFDIVD